MNAFISASSAASERGLAGSMARDLAAQDHAKRADIFVGQPVGVDGADRRARACRSIPRSPERRT